MVVVFLRAEPLAMDSEVAIQVAVDAVENGANVLNAEVVAVVVHDRPNAEMVVQQRVDPHSDSHQLKRQTHCRL